VRGVISQRSFPLKIALAVVTLAIIGTLTVVLYNRHSTKLQESSPEGRAFAEATAKDAKISDDFQDRANILAKDRCAAPANRLLNLNRSETIDAPSDIPAPLRDDLILCIERGILSGYGLDQLKDANLLRFFPKGI
jgi:hypothetical protein